MRQVRCAPRLLGERPGALRRSTLRKEKSSVRSSLRNLACAFSGKAGTKEELRPSSSIDRVAYITGVIESAAASSNERECARALRKTSEAVIASWDEDKNTPGKFWGERGDARDKNSPMEVIGDALMLSWERTFVHLASLGALDDVDLDWILQWKGARALEFVERHTGDSTSVLGVMLIERRAKALLTVEGATLVDFVRHVNAVPEGRRRGEIRSLLFGDIPREGDDVSEVVGQRFSKWIGPRLSTGVVLRTRGGKSMTISPSTRWDVEWRMPTKDDQKFAKWTSVDVQTLSYDQLLELIYSPPEAKKGHRRIGSGGSTSSTSSGGRGRRRGFISYLSRNFRQRQEQANQDEITAAASFASMIWGPASLCDHIVSKRVVNELDTHDAPSRLLRELYRSMASLGGDPLRALARARQELYGCMDGLIDDVIMSLWSGGLSAGGGSGNFDSEDDRAAGLVGMALEYGRALQAQGQCLADSGNWRDIDHSNRVKELQEILWQEIGSHRFAPLLDSPGMRCLVPQRGVCGEDQSKMGADFLPLVLANDQECHETSHMHHFDRRPHFSDPINGWFGVARLAFSTMETGHATYPTTATDERAPQTFEEFVSDWRSALLGTLRMADIMDSNGRYMGFSGKRIEEATLALCAALDAQGVGKPAEWGHLCKLMAKLGEDCASLCEHFSGTQSEHAKHAGQVIPSTSKTSSCQQINPANEHNAYSALADNMSGRFDLTDIAQMGNRPGNTPPACLLGCFRNPSAQTTYPRTIEDVKPELMRTWSSESGGSFHETNDAGCGYFYTLDIPARGRLGIMLHKNVIHAVKDSSLLSGQIDPGDTIIAVGDDNTEEMSTSEMMQLLTKERSKADEVVQLTIMSQQEKTYFENYENVTDSTQSDSRELLQGGKVSFHNRNGN